MGIYSQKNELKILLPVLIKQLSKKIPNKHLKLYEYACIYTCINVYTGKEFGKIIPLIITSKNENKTLWNNSI